MMENFKKNIAFFDIEPSNEAKIIELERQKEIDFPRAIFEFFLLAGEDYNSLFDGIGACSLKRIDYNINLAKELLADRDMDFEKKYFPFASYSGDQFLFIYLDEGDDPAVYRFETELYFCGEDYIQGSSSWGYPKGVSKVSDSFSKMIDEIVECKINDMKH